MSESAMPDQARAKRRATRATTRAPSRRKTPTDHVDDAQSAADVTSMDVTSGERLLPSSIRLRRQAIRGLETAWLEGGLDHGPIVVFLHGYPDTATIWSEQLAYFQEHYGVIAPYIRGAGPSSAADTDQNTHQDILARYRPDAVSLDLCAILAEVDPTKARPIHLIGHDLGAAHAWHLAPLLGARLATLTIINGLSIAQMARRWRRPRQWLRSWYILAAQMPGLPELAVGTRLGAKLMAKKLQTSGRADVEDTALRAPLAQYRAFLRAAPDVLRAPRTRLAAPVLVLFGDQDPFLLPPTRDELEPDTRDLTVRILRGRHWLQQECAAEVNRFLHAFFSTKGPRDD